MSYRIVISALLLVGALSLACNVFSPFTEAGDSTDKLALLDDANSALKNSDYEGATHFYERTLALYPDCSEALIGRAKCRFLNRMGFKEMADLGSRIQGRDAVDPSQSLVDGTSLIYPPIFGFPDGEEGVAVLRTWLDSTYQDLDKVFYRPTDNTADTLTITPHLDFAMLALLYAVVRMEAKAASFRVIWSRVDDSYHLEYNPSDLMPTDPEIDTVLVILKHGTDQAVWSLDNAQVEQRDLLRLVRDQIINVDREVKVYHQL